MATYQENNTVGGPLATALNPPGERRHRPPNDRSPTGSQLPEPGVNPQTGLPWGQGGYSTPNPTDPSNAGQMGPAQPGMNAPASPNTGYQSGGSSSGGSSNPGAMDYDSLSPYIDSAFQQAMTRLDQYNQQQTDRFDQLQCP